MPWTDTACCDDSINCCSRLCAQLVLHGGPWSLPFTLTHGSLGKDCNPKTLAHTILHFLRQNRKSVDFSPHSQNGASCRILPQALSTSPCAVVALNLKIFRFSPNALSLALTHHHVPSRLFLPTLRGSVSKTCDLRCPVFSLAWMGRGSK